MSEFANAKTIGARLNLKSPWLLLDCAERQSDTKLVGFKAFTANELFFVGHFPIHPIVPGVLHVEAVRQLAMTFAPGSAADWRVAKIEKVKFRRPILPGDRMKVDCDILESGDDVYKVKASCITASGSCSEATVTFAPAIKDGGLTVMPEINAPVDRYADIEMDTDKVMSLMPHRYPFLFIDYIAKTTESTVTAVKNVTANEHFFEAGFDAIPDVLLCEIGAQASCASILSRPENAGKLGFFMAIDNAVFHRPVYPGEQLEIIADLPSGKSKFGKGSGKICVGGEVVFEITLMFAIVDA